MDKNTLSNYGWIVIAVLVLSVMIALATPFGGYIRAGVENTVQGLFETEDAALGKVLDDMGIVPTTDQLQSKHKFDYYSTFRGAIADANANTIGVNADATKDSATAGVYTENGETFVVLLKDTTETSEVTVTADMTINLGGNILNFDSNTGITNTKDTQNTINIDGRLKNSTITSNIHSVYWKSGNININGGIYISTDESDTIASIRVENATGIIENCTISSTSESKTAVGMYFKGSTGTVKNTNISTKNKDGKSQSVYFSESSTGTIENCTISATSENNSVDGIVFASTGTVHTVKNSSVSAKTKDGKAKGIAFYSGTTGIIENCTITATSENNSADGIVFASTGTVHTVKNSSVSAKTKDGKAKGIAFNSGTTGIIENCTITAHANYASDGSTYTAIGLGLYGGVNSTIDVKNCNISGIHSGIQTAGSLNVDGGTYEGYGHGGFYFTGAGTTSYVKNATIRECAMPDGYITNIDSNYTGFYVGGNNNITVYMDNCDIYGSKRPFVLRGSSGEQNNTLYISNSNINTSAKIRIDNDTHKLYIGKGNNFTAENTTRPSSVIITDETYCQ